MLQHLIKISKVTKPIHYLCGHQTGQAVLAYDKSIITYYCSGCELMPGLNQLSPGLHVISCCLRVYNVANEDYKGLVRRL